MITTMQSIGEEMWKMFILTNEHNLNIYGYAIWQNPSAFEITYE